MALSRIAADRYHRVRHEPEAAKRIIGEATMKSSDKDSHRCAEKFTRIPESLRRFCACIGTMNLPGCGSPVRCPAFRRYGPAKAGTPNRRFMERTATFQLKAPSIT